ncbi:hypothetical protein M427DRAFT_133075 [Gonapodya prolifera JEL478]|uniref:Uncharacterized protein n=1 Tax=Gonapodya prolifera (strain JEL478) TaxID=1344416 RepID=A0A139AMU3_GONPJ|nr:hypothetical protein M427DRAFT_133075 [Gonapodya prolifera JEL478]|eukprot:KXS17904.1 hypothetical protein M427DRAFT_133075 [Gonapodya prolifera JEL478]
MAVCLLTWYAGANDDGDVWIINSQSKDGTGLNDDHNLLDICYSFDESVTVVPEAKRWFQ